MEQDEYLIFVKKLKVQKDKKTTVVPVLARKSTITSQASIDQNEVMTNHAQGTPKGETQHNLCIYHAELDSYLKNELRINLVAPPQNNHYFKALKRFQIQEEAKQEEDRKNTLIGTAEQTIQKVFTYALSSAKSDPLQLPSISSLVNLI